MCGLSDIPYHFHDASTYLLSDCSSHQDTLCIDSNSLFILMMLPRISFYCNRAQACISHQHLVHRHLRFSSQSTRKVHQSTLQVQQSIDTKDSILQMMTLQISYIRNSAHVCSQHRHISIDTTSSAMHASIEGEPCECSIPIRVYAIVIVGYTGWVMSEHWSTVCPQMRLHAIVGKAFHYQKLSRFRSWWKFRRSKSQRAIIPEPIFMLPTHLSHLFRKSYTVPKLQ